MTRTKPSAFQRARGFTLTEALVALVVLSIGLLGVAALQLTSLRSNQSSAMRSQATFLAYDIVDRMRANRAAAANGSYNTAYGGTKAAGTVAGDDVIAWKQSIAATLPKVDIDGNGTLENADGSITLNGSIFTIGIVWSDSDDTKGAKGRTKLEFKMDTQIN